MHNRRNKNIFKLCIIFTITLILILFNQKSKETFEIYKTFTKFMFTTKNTTWCKTFNKNEIKTTIESFQMTNQDYQMNLLDYLKKWNRSLSTGKSVL
jgi:hypothetical protein